MGCRHRCFSREKADGTESAALQRGEEYATEKRTRQMKTIAYLTLVGGLALACAGPAFAGPDRRRRRAKAARRIPLHRRHRRRLGQDVTDYINSLPPDSGDGATVIIYDPSRVHAEADRRPERPADFVVRHRRADDRGLRPVLADPHVAAAAAVCSSRSFFNAPTGNLGESDAAGEGYMFSVTARSINSPESCPSRLPSCFWASAWGARAGAARTSA